ncbi:MAG: hypothetical protein AAFY71_09980 [Bacteroidota bacterium]
MNRLRYPNPFSVLFLGLILLVAMISACTDMPKDHATSLAIVKTSQVQKFIPDLLPRNASLGSLQEQRKVLSTYEMLKNAINQNPTDYRKRIQLAQLFMLEARVTGEHGHYYPAALQVLDGILQEASKPDVVFGAKSLKASVKLSLHEFKEAKKLAEEAVQLNGYNALIYGSLVDAHVELGEYDKAISMADKMMSIRPDIRSYSRVSYLRELHGDIEGAIDAMEMAVKAGYPGYEETSWAALNLGNLYQKDGRIPEAKAIYEGILENREDYPFAMAALAELDRLEGNYHQAEKRLLAAIDIIPEVSFFEQLTSLLQEMNRMKEADKMKKEVMDMLADDEANGHKMGMEYARFYLEIDGKIGMAREYALKEYAYRPNNIDVNQLLAAIEIKAGEYEVARKYLRQANITGTINDELVAMNALMLEYDGKKKEAERLLKTHAKKHPKQNHIFVDYIYKNL